MALITASLSLCAGSLCDFFPGIYSRRSLCMCFCMRQTANMKGVLFPSIPFPLPDSDLIPAILILKKTLKNSRLPVVLTHTYTCMCTHLLLKSCVTIYELATSRSLRHACVTQPGGTACLEIARAFTPQTCLQHGAVYRRLLLCCWAACICCGMLA